MEFNRLMDVWGAEETNNYIFNEKRYFELLDEAQED
jgi:hypothetical protein